MKNSKLHTTEDKSNEKVTSSNSKSEDTQDFTPDEAVVCTKCGYGEWRHDSLKHPCNVFEPTQDTSLTEITAEYFMATDPDRVALQRKVLAWHKAEIAKLFEQMRSEVNSMYELSITDLELRQHQQGVEIPVLPKTQLLEALTRLEQK